MVTRLINNIAEFSAFKEASFRKLLLSELTKNKTVPTWSEFKKRALELDIKYNKTWLETEYHQTIASANMAEKWKEFERDADLYPNLKYVIVGDERTRDKHREWNGLVFPINHPIWKTLLPPNDWGCRCTVVQTDEPASKKLPEFDIKKEFKNNTALTGKVFKEIPYKDTLTATESIEAIQNNKSFVSNELINTASKYVKIHPKADPSDLRRNYFVAKEIGEKLNIDFIIREHVETTGFKNPEYLIRNKHLGDRKSIKENSGITWGIDKAKKQMLNKQINPNKLPYYIVYDLDGVEDLNIDLIINQLQRKITKERGRNIKSLIFYYKQKAMELTRDNIVKREFDNLKKLF